MKYTTHRVKSWPTQGLPSLQNRGFYSVYTEEFQNYCLSMTCLGLLFFPFPEANECCLCFVSLAHRWIETKSHIHTRQPEIPDLELEILAGPLTHWGQIFVNEKLCVQQTDFIFFLGIQPNCIFQLFCSQVWAM